MLNFKSRKNKQKFKLDPNRKKSFVNKINKMKEDEAQMKRLKREKK